MLKIVVERLLRLATVARYRCRAPLVALLETADAAEVAADTTGEVGKLDVEVRQCVKQTAVDDAHGRNHQGKLPAEHAPEIVDMKLRPGNDGRQRVNEHIEPKIGSCPPERQQGFGVQRLPLQFGRNHHARKAKIDRAALQFCRSIGRFQRRNMGKPDEPARMIDEGSVTVPTAELIAASYEATT